MADFQKMTSTLRQEWQRQQDRLSKQNLQSSGSPPSMATSSTGDMSIEGMMEDLAQQIAVLESRLQVSNTVAQFLEQRAKQAEEEKQVNQNRTKELSEQLESLRQRRGTSSNSSAGSLPMGGAVDSGKMKRLEVEISSLKQQLERKDELLNSLEAKCSKQKMQVEQLQKQVVETEEKLNTSYIATLDELTGQIKELQEELKESQDALKAAGGGSSTTGGTGNASEPGEDNEDGQQQDRPQQERRVQIAMEAADTPEAIVFTRKIRDMESKLALTTKVSEYLQQKLVAAETDRDVNAARVAELTAQVEEMSAKHTEQMQEAELKISDLDFKLHNNKRMLTFAQQKGHKDEEAAQKLKLSLEEEVRDLKNKLVTQQRMAKFMEGRVTTTLEEKKAKEEELAAQIFDLDFKLSGKARVCKFLETSLEKSKKEGMDINAKYQATAKECKEKERQLAELEEKLAAHEKLSNAQQSKLETAMPQLADLRSRLSVMNGVGETLQAQVNEMSKDQHLKDEKIMHLSQQIGELQAKSQEKQQEAEIKISDLDFKLIDAKRVLKSLLDKYNKAQTDSKQSMDSLSKENENLRERLGKAKQVVDHLQDSVSKATTDQSDLEDKLKNQISDLEFKLSESIRKSKFLETSFVQGKDERQKLENQINTLTEGMEKMKAIVLKKEAAHKAEMESLRARVSIADRVGEFVKQNNQMLASTKSSKVNLHASTGSGGSRLSVTPSTTATTPTSVASSSQQEDTTSGGLLQQLSTPGLLSSTTTSTMSRPVAPVVPQQQQQQQRAPPQVQLSSPQNVQSREQPVEPEEYSSSSSHTSDYSDSDDSYMSGSWIALNE